MTELKSVYVDRTGDWVKIENNTGKFYLKEEVDAAIAELKAKLAEKESWVKMLGEGERALSLELENTKQKLENVNELIKTARQMLEDAKATHYAEMVDAGMRERRLRRALYKACANWAHFAVAFFSTYAIKEKWRKMERKCRAKMEEHK